MHDHEVLRPQTRPSPGGFAPSLLLVCKRCYDLPHQFMRTVSFPVDPPNLPFPSPEPYDIDEDGSYPPSPTAGAVYILGGAPLGEAPMGGVT